MDITIVSELEEASRLLMATPEVVSREQRQAAEQVFMKFKRTQSPFRLCKHILETSKVDQVLFEAASLLMAACIREWELLPVSEKVYLVEYLLQYIWHKDVPSFVQCKLMQGIAVIIKRGSINDVILSRRQILITIEEMITNDDLQKAYLCCKMILSILQEYAATVHSSDMGLNFEAHLKAKEQFEETDLVQIFEFCVSVLHRIIKDSTNVYSEEMLKVLEQLLAICDAILCWNYAYSRDISSFDSEIHPPFKPSEQWEDMLLNNLTLHLFFHMHLSMRTYPAINQHTLSCLKQLSSISGTIFSRAPEDKMNYIKNYVSFFLELVPNIISNLSGKEALGISICVQNLTFIQYIWLEKLPAPLLKSFILHTAQMIQQWGVAADKEEQNCLDDESFKEAYENMNVALLSLLENASNMREEMVSGVIIPLFDIYLKLRLYPPHGNRTDLENDDDDKNACGHSSDYQAKYGDQLQVVGHFGRQALDHTVPLLADLIEQESSRLQNLLERKTSCVHCSDSHYQINENLLWLLTIAGYVLSVDCKGETASIPLQIMQYSIQQSICKGADYAATLKLFTSLTTPPSEIKSSLESCDPVVRLVCSVLRLCEMERQAACIHNLNQDLSPALTCNIMWFLEKWATCYLCPDEQLYTELSTALLCAFGTDSSGSLWISNYLFNKIEANLQCFHYDSDIINATSKLLNALVDSKEKGKLALKTENFPKLLISLQTKKVMFPEGCKRALYKAAVRVGVALESQQKEMYWSKVIKPMVDRFRCIVHQDSFGRIFHEEAIKTEIIDSIECVIGITEGTLICTAGDLFRQIEPILSDCSTIIEVYHNYLEVVQMILEFFYACANSMLSYLHQENGKMLHQAILLAVRLYTEKNKGRFSVEVGAEEQAYQDVILLLELLIALLSNDFIEDADLNDSWKYPADTVLFAMNCLMPLLSIELLKFPNLCHHYFRLLSLLSELYPEKMFSLEEPLLGHLTKSLCVGLRDCDSETAVLSFDVLKHLASHLYHSPELHISPVTNSLQRFMEIITDMILTHHISSDTVSNASEALYCLICCFKDGYTALMNHLLHIQSTQMDYHTVERLAGAFNGLLSNMNFSMEPGEKKKFQEHYENFVADVNRFLVFQMIT